ncbi:YDG/SRA domain-containing protein [Saccharopolyspora cebuensis]|uniref:YDG/SRA domain-containing protein n=1 Tax=Saccharopolyspora cebuensis TaxID=418759 RepID=A0ABV4CH03_9PSEU
MSLADITGASVHAVLYEPPERDPREVRAQLGLPMNKAKYFVKGLGRKYLDIVVVADTAHRLATGSPLSAHTQAEGDIARQLAALGVDVRSKEADRKTVAANLGSVPGIRVGEVFAGREAVRVAGLHRHNQAGISGNGGTGAEAIVISGGYVDDEDHGWLVVYTGEGGRDQNTKRQIADQTFSSSGNAALKKSCLEGLPVRVIRKTKAKHDTQNEYRYDGLYSVERYWREKGRDGFLICRFRMVALPGAEFEPPADGERNPDTAATEQPTDQVPAGVQEPRRSPTTADRVQRSAKVVAHVKALYNNECQACRTRLVVGDRAHSEGAHIRPLGRPHDGPDTPNNMLCLCPNCHIQFDGGALLVDDDLAMWRNGLREDELHLREDHLVNTDYFAYHRSIHR